MKNFEYELPSNYKEIYSIDASNKKIGIFMNVVAMIIILIIATPLVIWIFSSYDNITISIGIMLLFSLIIIAYVVLHELTHGVAYYSLTHQKLTFGITLSVAFCGVPNIFVYKKTALIALLSPFILFSIVFVAGIIFLPTPELKLLASVVFATHFGGCVGDLYCTYLLLLKFKGDVLIKDTGPKQTFYSNV